MKSFLIMIFSLGIGCGIGWLLHDYYKRPCIMEEERIMKRFDVPAANQMIKLLNSVNMYEDLIQNGCPENAENYKQKMGVDIQAMQQMLAEQDAAEVHDMAITIDMQKVSNAMGEATREAAAAIGSLMDRIKNTKVNIVVE